MSEPDGELTTAQKWLEKAAKRAERAALMNTAGADDNDGDQPNMAKSRTIPVIFFHFSFGSNFDSWKHALTIAVILQ